MVRRSYHVARASRLGESLELGDGQRHGAVFRLERRDALLPGLDSTDRRERPHACSIEKQKQKNDGQRWELQREQEQDRHPFNNHINFVANDNKSWGVRHTKTEDATMSAAVAKNTSRGVKPATGHHHHVPGAKTREGGSRKHSFKSVGFTPRDAWNAPQEEVHPPPSYVTPVGSSS